MNVQLASEMRKLTAGELDAVSGGPHQRLGHSSRRCDRMPRQSYHGYYRRHIWLSLRAAQVDARSGPGGAQTPEKCAPLASLERRE
jgi:hypothetical protein